MSKLESNYPDKCVCTTHSDCPEVGCIIQPVDCSRVQAQVVVLAKVPIQLQLLCGTQTMWLLFKPHLLKKQVC